MPSSMTSSRYTSLLVNSSLRPWFPTSTKRRFCNVLPDFRYLSLAPYTSKHQFKYIVHPSTFCRCQILNECNHDSQFLWITSPSTRYTEPLYNLDVRAEHSKAPRAPLLGDYARPEFVISHGKGSYVWDTEGRKYLDFSAGIAWRYVYCLGAPTDIWVLVDYEGTKNNLYDNEWSPHRLWERLLHVRQCRTHRGDLRSGWATWCTDISRWGASHWKWWKSFHIE